MPFRMCSCFITGRRNIKVQMAPDKDQAEDKTESDYLPYQWWTDVGENEPDCRRKLRMLRSERKTLLQRLGGKVKSDQEEVVTRTQDIRYNLRTCALCFQGSRGGRLRVKLLAAIGKCETLREFGPLDLEDLHLQPKEWEALLKRMKGNCQLLERIVWRPQGLSARIGRHIGELAGHLTTLELLNVYSSDLSEEECLQELAGIASGLQGHKHAKLVNFTASCVDDSTNIVKIISSAPRLSYISLEGPYNMDENTKVGLSAALKECSDLKRITLTFTSEGILEVLGNVYAQRFSAPQQVSVLESLKLEGPTSLTGLACLASSSIRYLEIELNENLMKYACSSEEWQRVGRSLVRHPTLRVFKLQVIISNYYKRAEKYTSVNLVNGLAELWEASERSPLLDISVLVRRSFIDEYLMFLVDTLKNYLKVITFEEVEVDPRSFKTLAEMVGASTSVRRLRLSRLVVHGGDFWSHFFYHLRENTSITTVDLSHSWGLNDENFRDLMDLLEVNFILREVELGETGWDSDSKRALVQAALKRNAKLAGYFSVLGAAQLSFDGAKAG